MFNVWVSVEVGALFTSKDVNFPLDKLKKVDLKSIVCRPTKNFLVAQCMSVKIGKKFIEIFKKRGRGH